MTQLYEKPTLTVHGRVEQLTQNTGLTADDDFTILTGSGTSVPGIDGSRDFTVSPTGGQGFQD